MHKYIFLSLLLFSLENTKAQNTPVSYVYNDGLLATDAIGRELYSESDSSSAKQKYVGVFYFVWHRGDNADKVYDISKLIKENHEDPQYGPVTFAHWWGEPEVGYFHPSDPWYIRRSLQMLSNAGVDFLYLEWTINKMYDDFYSNLNYKDLWFYWEGKPLIFGIKSDTVLRDEVKEFFTFRSSWFDTPQGNPGEWQWADFSPQDWAWKDNPTVAEQLPVSVGTHAHANNGSSETNNIQPTLNKYKLTEFTGQGLHFQEQWDRAHLVQPEVVMVTGWNEWIAGRYQTGIHAKWDKFLDQKNEYGDTYFVDAYNQEFMRDIEPMKGGHSDNYYYQLVSNIRKFKGTESAKVYSKSITQKIEGKFKEWQDVMPVYTDFVGDTEHRNYRGFDKNSTYTNFTGRNDIVETRVTNDDDNLFFYVKTRNKLTSEKNKNWMLLFVDSDTDKSTGWQGYDFVINKNVKSKRISSLSKYENGKWIQVSNINYRIKNNELELAVPLEKLGITSEINIEFHWADNIQKDFEIEEFFLNGDSAPDRRFNYSYNTYHRQMSIKLGTPLKFVASKGNKKTINLRWIDNSVNENKYIIERSLDGVSEWENIALIKKNSTFYSDKKLNIGTTYFYRVYSENDSSKSKYSNVSSATLSSNTLPKAPTNLNLDSDYNLRWDDNSDNEYGFIIKIYDAKNGRLISERRLIRNTKIYSLSGLEPKTSCIAKVFSYNDLGESKYSNFLKFNVPDALPILWIFKSGTAGWSINDLTGGGHDNNNLKGISIGDDPYLQSPFITNTNLDELKTVEIKFKNMSDASKALIMFRTDEVSEWTSFVFDVNSNDSKYTTYSFNMNSYSKWRGNNIQLRVYPVGKVKSKKFAIDYIRLK